MGKNETVCVTGAGGYLASWVVKFLLSKGYMVHGTVRDPCDDKNAHLKKLENASENLKIFKTDLLDYEGLCAAIAGCTGVFHVACPVLPSATVVNPEVELYEPAINGTQNVLNACSREKIKKVVVVSSVGAVVLNPNWPMNRPMDEECWSDVEFCKANKQWYFLAKTVAESEAWEHAKRSELNIVTVCPSLIIGPLLQSTMNASSLYLLRLLRGHILKLKGDVVANNVYHDGSESARNGPGAFVDVRDVADAILLTYEKTEAEGRYICSSFEIKTHELVEMLKSMYPNYNYPKSYNGVETEMKLSSEKLKNLGWKYRPLEQTIVDAVKNYEESGALGEN